MPMRVSAKGRRFLNSYSQAQKFRATVQAHENEAAKVATAMSKKRFSSRLSGRPIAPSRPGRPSTGGAFGNDIEWARANSGNIRFELAKLPQYAIIQEIGTGQEARITNPAGHVSVRSQYGREISANLFWASGAGGTARRAQTGASGDQLFFASDLNAKSVGQLRRRKKRIRREIKGKHFIGDGGNAGYLELRTRLTDEANRIFR